MSEREQIDVLKFVPVTLALVQNLPSRVKRTATGPLKPHTKFQCSPFNRSRHKEKGCAHAHVHVRTYLASTFAKRLS